MKLITQTFLGGESPTLSRPYHFKFSKGCLPQILLVPFLNTLSNLTLIAFSPFQVHFSFLQPLQTQRFSDVFRDIDRDPWPETSPALLPAATNVGGSAPQHDIILTSWNEVMQYPQPLHHVATFFQSFMVFLCEQ